MAGKRSGTHARSPRALLAGLTVITAIGAVACGSDSGTKASTGGTRPDTSTSGAGPASTTAGSGAMPGLILAAMPDRRLAVLRGDDGSVMRVLAEHIGGDDPRGDMSIAASRDTAFFSYGLSWGGPAVLESIGIDGQRRQRIGSGFFPAVSPDGKRLAYIHDGIVVRDLRTTLENTFPVVKDQGIRLLSWAPDSRHLLVVGGDGEPDGAGPDINHVLDTNTRGSLSDANKLPLAGQHEVAGLLLGELGDTGDWAEVASTRVPIPEGEPGRGSAATRAKSRLVALDSRTGDELRTLYTFPLGDDSLEYNNRRFNSDNSGKHLLWVAHVAARRGSVIFRYSMGDPAAVAIGENVEQAVWVPGS